MSPVEPHRRDPIALASRVSGLDPRSREATFNASSRDQWDGFADHRARVSALLGAGTGPGPTRLCVLGAGNANDLDLPALLGAHREVHLVDIDAEALARGIARQGVVDHRGLRCHGGVDLSGMIDPIGSWTPRSAIRPEDVRALADWPADRVARALPGPFDLVASTCLLRPLIGNAFQSVGGRHSQFRDLVRAMRAGHLRLLARLVAPGGMAVLISDIASTDQLPELRTAPESALPGLLERVSREGAALHGVHPPALLASFRSESAAIDAASRVTTVAPWRWRLHDRVYLVWGLGLRRGGASPSSPNPGDRP